MRARVAAQIEAAQYVHLLAIDDVEQPVGETPQHSPAHVAVNLVERRIGLKVVDADQLVEKLDTQSPPDRLVFGIGFFDSASAAAL